MKKFIYSNEYIIRFAKAAINRYTDFLSKMGNNDKGLQELRQLTERKTENEKNYKGFNPLDREDNIIFQQLLNGIFVSDEFTNKDLSIALLQISEDFNWSASKVSRLLKRLRVFCLLRKVNKTYRYFLTEKGRLLLLLSVKLRNLTAIPALNSLYHNNCLACN